MSDIYQLLKCSTIHHLIFMILDSARLLHNFALAGWSRSKPVHLPCDILHEILPFLAGDLRALKQCSLTCKEFLSVVQPLILRRVKLVGRPCSHLPKRCPPYCDHSIIENIDRDLSESRITIYAQEMYLDLRLCTPLQRTQILERLNAFKRVNALKIRSFSLKAHLHTFSPLALKTLHMGELYDHDGAPGLLQFISQFPHLENLALMYDTAKTTEASEGWRSCTFWQDSPPLRGGLVLRKFSPWIPLWELPRGIHFRSIEVDHQWINPHWLNELLTACTSTLEVFTLIFNEGPVDTMIDLRDSKALTEFKLVGTVTFSSIRRLVKISDLIQLMRLPNALPTRFARFVLEIGVEDICAMPWEVIDTTLNRTMPKDFNLVVTPDDLGESFSNGGAFAQRFFPRMESRSTVKDGGGIVCLHLK